MKPPEEVAHGLARNWLAKAATDLLVCRQLLGQGAVVAELTPYGVEYRYPGEYAPVSAETAITCVSPARKAHDEIARRLPEDIRR